MNTTRIIEPTFHEEYHAVRLLLSFLFPLRIDQQLAYRRNQSLAAKSRKERKKLTKPLNTVRNGGIPRAARNDEGRVGGRGRGGGRDITYTPSVGREMLVARKRFVESQYSTELHDTFFQTRFPPACWRIIRLSNEWRAGSRCIEFEHFPENEGSVLPPASCLH